VKKLVNYSLDDVCELLDSIYLGKCKDAFRKEEITGGKLALCDRVDVLMSYGVSSKGDAKLLLNRIKQISGRMINKNNH